jgi:hypothetical protein
MAGGYSWPASHVPISFRGLNTAQHVALAVALRPAKPFRNEVSWYCVCTIHSAKQSSCYARGISLTSPSWSGFIWRLSGR